MSRVDLRQVVKSPLQPTAQVVIKSALGSHTGSVLGGPVGRGRRGRPVMVHIDRLIERMFGVLGVTCTLNSMTDTVAFVA